MQLENVVFNFLKGLIWKKKRKENKRKKRIQRIQSKSKAPVFDESGMRPKNQLFLQISINIADLAAALGFFLLTFLPSVCEYWKSLTTVF